MADRALALGYSPCPNDTYTFFALSNGRLSTAPYRFDVSLADVEELNGRAQRGELDVVKVSMHALFHLLGDYALLRSGGAMGRGCGPLIVSRKPAAMEELENKAIAIPGKRTTAHLLLQLQGSHRGPRPEMLFSDIMPAVARGEVDAGLIIHEGRFTYPSLGLHRVLDLGAWWEERTGLPLPLGGILIRRSLGGDTARFVEAKIRESISYARARPHEAWPYVREHAQEMEPEVIQKHIDTFVNDFTLDMGGEGERAVAELLQAAARFTGQPVPAKALFADGNESGRFEIKNANNPPTSQERIK